MLREFYREASSYAEEQRRVVSSAAGTVPPGGELPGLRSGGVPRAHAVHTVRAPKRGGDGEEGGTP